MVPSPRRARDTGLCGSQNLGASLSLVFGCPVACRTLVPLPGVEPRPLAVRAWRLNHWTAREFPTLLFKETVRDSSPCPGVRSWVLCAQPSLGLGCLPWAEGSLRPSPQGPAGRWVCLPLQPRRKPRTWSRPAGLPLTLRVCARLPGADPAPHGSPFGARHHRGPWEGGGGPRHRGV